jgi:hypothetical protein
LPLARLNINFSFKRTAWYVLLLLVVFGYNKTLQAQHQDSNSTVISFIKKTLPQGQITASYEYGLLPFLVQLNPPQGNFKTQGQFAIQAGSLPFNASFFYNSVGTISGLNNYFRVQFDAQRYQQQLKERFLQSQLDKVNDLKDLQLQKQHLTQRLGYLDMVKSGTIQIPQPTTTSLPNPLPDSIPTIQLPDSLPIGALPSSPPLPSPTQYIGWNDSLSKIHDELSDKLNTINNQISSLERYKNLNGDSLFISGTYPEEFNLPKWNKYFSNIKTFDVGLCYPGHSVFTVANIPVRGVNIEYNEGKFYFAATHGKTVNNIFFTNNLVSNNLNAMRNLYNFFDFNNIEDGRKITAVKIGYGQKEKSHIYVGGLYGIGRVSYFDSTRTDVERNAVVEIDGKFVYKKHFVDLFYGRSSTQANAVNYEESASVFDQLTNFQINTNAWLVRNTLSFDKFGTQLKLTFRYVDPFFRSFGIGFIRSDNVRYEIRADQRLGKKLKLSGFFRHEEDNLLNLYAYKNVLRSYGAGFTYRPTKKWMIKSDIRPIIQEVNASVDTLSLSNTNYILNVISTYQNRIKDYNYSMMGVYSYYQLFNGEQNNVYQNINFSFMIRDKAKWNNNLSYNYFATNEDIGIPPTNILLNEFMYKMNKLEISTKGKFAFSQQTPFDFGYGLRLSLRLSKLLSYELSGEKLVFGDFYNSLALSQLNEFPYFFTTSLKLQW